MTIGIAASGHNAGAAVCDALLGAELLGRGSIGGFAVFVIFDAAGVPRWRKVQDGGLGALDLPADWAHAERAAVISSGPNRPEPLEQFLPAAAGRGLVTGHRLPSSPTAAGVPINSSVLAEMTAAGLSQERLDALLSSEPELDAGLLALGCDGRIALGNTARVQRRNDLGQFHHMGPEGSIGVLLNTIYCAGGPPEHLARRIGQLALDRLRGQARGIVRLEGAVPLVAAARDCARVDGTGTILRLETSNPISLQDTRRVTVLYSGAEIVGPDGPLGTAETEIFAAVANGMALPYEALAARRAVCCPPEKQGGV